MSEIEEKIKEMQGGIDKQVTALANAVENKLGIPASSIKDEFESVKTKLSEILVTDDDNVINTRAWARLKYKWNKELRSDKPVYEGMIVGVADAYDALAFQHRTAKEVFEHNPEKAVADGLTDENGKALDTQKTFANGVNNPNYGKPLPDTRWIRHVIGAYSPVGSTDAPEKFWMTLTDDDALTESIPVMQAVRFRGDLAKTTTPNGWARIYPSGAVFSVFESKEIVPENVLKLFGEISVAIDGIKDIHPDNLGNKNVYVTEGDVAYVSTRPNPKTHNKRITIASDDIGMDEYTVWVPPHLCDDVDFDVGSRVCVVGTIREAMFNDNKTYNVTAWGIYAYEDMKIPLGSMTEGPEVSYSETY